MKISKETMDKDFLDQVEEMSGEELSSCYQCGKCSAGCPMVGEMHILPHEIIRFLQLGIGRRH